MNGRLLVLVLAACGDNRIVDLVADASGPDATGASAVVLVSSWGGFGTAPGLFVEPSSVEVDSVGFVYVAGHEDRVQKFTAEGELVKIWGTSGTGDGQFDHPHGLAIDRRRGDLVYVGDQENGRMQVFSSDGAFVRLWTDPQFQHIHDVGIDPASGDLFVGDYELDVLQRFRPTGSLVVELGGTGSGPGEFAGIWGVSTDSSGNIYTADTGNRRIQKLAPDGNFVAEWTSYAGIPFQKPTGVFVDTRDVIYVCDSLAERILLFDRDGVVLEVWNMRDVLGEVSEPEDVVIDPTSGQIFVVEVRSHRVHRLTRRD